MTTWEETWAVAKGDVQWDIFFKKNEKDWVKEITQGLLPSPFLCSFHSNTQWVPAGLHFLVPSLRKKRLEMPDQLITGRGCHRCSQ